MALGALEALDQVGIPKGKVMVLGFDAIPDSLVKVRDGELAATVEQLPAEQVGNAMTAMVAYLRDKKPIEGNSGFCSDLFANDRQIVAIQQAVFHSIRVLLQLWQ